MEIFPKNLKKDRKFKTGPKFMEKAEKLESGENLEEKEKKSGKSWESGKSTPKTKMFEIFFILILEQELKKEGWYENDKLIRKHRKLSAKKIWRKLL